MCARVSWDFVRKKKKKANAQATEPSLRVQLRESGERPKQLSLNTAEDSDGSPAWMVLQGFDDKWLDSGF